MDLDLVFTRSEKIMRHIFPSAIALAFAAFSFGQVGVTSYSGDVSLNGSPFGGGTVGYGDQVHLGAQNGGIDYSSFNLSALPNNSSFFPGRYQMKATATVNGADVQLPNGRDGSTFSATDGDVSIFSTWDTAFYPQSPSPHTFSMSVDATGGGDGSIDLDIEAAPTPSAILSGGSWTHDILDNSIYDQDPTVGSIVIDKTVNPILNLNFTLPEYTFNRDAVQWADGSTSNSAFRDDSSTSMWFLLDGAAIYGSPFSPAQTFAAGEGPGAKIVNPFSGTVVVDLNTIALGTYTGRYWSIPWNTYGYDNDLGGLSIGSVNLEYVESNIQIVPEPTSIIAIGIAVTGYLGRRRAKRS